MIIQNRGFVWSPRSSYSVSYSVTGSILVNGVEVVSKATYIEWTRAVTDKAGSCEIRINNYDGSFAGMFHKKDTIEIFGNYSDGTTKQFSGYVRDIVVGFDGYSYLKISGLDWAGESLNRVVNKKYSTAMTLDAIFKDLVALYLPGHTTANVADMSAYGTFTPTFNNESLLECFKDLMGMSGNNFCFYCDFDKDWNVFEKGSRYNLYEPIIHTRNLIKLEIEDSLSDMATKVTVYGQDQEGMPMLVTVSEDPEGVGTIHEVYRNTNLTTYAALLQSATDILNSKKTSEFKCKTATVKGMIDLSPGDSIYVFFPIGGEVGERFVNEFTQTIEGALSTKVKYQVQHKIPEDLSTIIKDRMDENQELLSADNPNDLENSYNFTFDDSSGIGALTNTVVSNGSLSLASGQTTGTMVTDVRSALQAITKAEVKASGNNLGDSTFEISVDGLNWVAVARNTLLDVTYSGSSLKLRVTLNSTTLNPGPSIESLAVLYT